MCPSAKRLILLEYEDTTLIKGLVKQILSQL